VRPEGQLRCHRESVNQGGGRVKSWANCSKMVTKQKGGGDLTLLIPDLETEYDAESTPTKSPSSTWSPSNKSSSPTASKSSPEQSYLPCHCCRPNHQNRKTSGAEESKLGSNSSSLSWKLLLLLTIAIAALASILVISHQLISRHLSTSDRDVTLSLTIPANGWMNNQGLHHKLQHPLKEKVTNSGEHHTHDQAEDLTLVREDNVMSRYKLTTRPEGSQYKLAFHSPLSLENKLGDTIVSDGMYWSSEVEAKIPTGVPEDLIEGELFKLRSRTVKALEEPSWLKCGREQNRFVRFQDGSAGCARYREPNTELVVGEVASFYLARILGITNVPPVVLSQVDPNNPVWSSALNDVESSSWRLGSVVALTSWLPDLIRTGMPAILREALLARSTIDISTSTSSSTGSENLVSKNLGHFENAEVFENVKDFENVDQMFRTSLSDLSLEEAAEVAQWSDLVVFDFLTGNYDRVSSMQDTAEKEDRPEVLSETIHNLVKSSQTGGLWLLDNESGLLDAYAVLYPSPEMGLDAEREAIRFRAMQTDLLQTTCIFRRQTVDRVFNLYKSGDGAALLDAFVSKAEPLYRDLLLGLSDIQQNAWRSHFQERVEEVWTWMKQCQEDVRFW